MSLENSQNSLVDTPGSTPVSQSSDNSLTLKDQVGLLVAELSRMTGLHFLYQTTTVQCQGTTSLPNSSMVPDGPFNGQLSPSDLPEKDFLLILNVLHILN